MSARKLIPILDRVLVERFVPPAKSAGGILLPESAASKVNQGTVLAVGPGRRSTTGDLIPPSVKAGDQVLLPEYGGTPVELGQTDEKEWFVFRDDEILGVLTSK